MATTLLSSGLATRPARLTSQGARRRAHVAVRAEKPLREFREDTGEVRQAAAAAGAAPLARGGAARLAHARPAAASDDIRGTT